MTATGLVLALAGLAPAVLALYLFTLSAASFWYRPLASDTTGRSRLAVLVPAHNEEALVERCVRSLLDQTYPRGLYTVVVIADNCTDATAERAAAAGAQVLVRSEPEARGKGQALAWAIARVSAWPAPPDAYVVVDADSVADEDLLVALVSECSAGAQAVQGEYLVLDPDATPRSQLIAAGFLLFHRVRLSGRAVLGMPANLVGNGMLFSRELLTRHPWRAFSGVEDLEYTIDLRLAGVRPRFTAGARVVGPIPRRRGAVTVQRLRWEGGRWHVVRKRIGALLKASIVRRDARLLDAVLDLAVPPLGLLALIIAAGVAAGGLAVLLRLAPAWTLAPWLIALACLVAFVGTGLVSSKAPSSTYRAFLAIPAFMVWKLEAYVKLLAGFDPRRWERSERAIEGTTTRAVAGIDVAGVRIDPIDMDGALERMRCALARSDLFHVATVNMDFLARAQTNRAMRDVFQRSHMNLPDGAPVVWLGRLLGHHVPARVAGADLVPLFMRDAAEARAPVFLLGGEDGAAASAAAELRRMHPGLVIAGSHEPPRTPIEEMDNEAILQQIADSRAKILLVALGHPKQDLWIDRHRDRLQVSVAVGVGCVFDLIAGRRRRAPLWMQRHGLEWLYRVAAEPRRLLGRYLADASWLALLSTRLLLERVTGRHEYAHG